MEFLQNTYKIEKQEEPVQTFSKKVPNVSPLTVARLMSIENDIFKGDIQDFVVSKNLHNIFLEEDIHERLISHITRFDDRVWYAERGIPRTLGILLHGTPGCGKTSFIKALCASQKRTALIIDFKMIKTVNHLRQVFGGHMETKSGTNYNFDKQKVIYVFEDFDCMCDIFMDRDIKAQQDQQTIQNEAQAMMKYRALYKKKWKHKRRSLDHFDLGDESDDDKFQDTDLEDKEPKKLSKITSGDEKITLADFLELLDGIIEMDGRIIIMTTNCRDKIDKALLRPGRIDLDLELNPPSRALICEIFFYMYQHLENHVLEGLWQYYHNKMPNKTVSTAKVMNSFMYMDPRQGMEALSVEERSDDPTEHIEALIRQSRGRVAERINFASETLDVGADTSNTNDIVDIYEHVVLKEKKFIGANGHLSIFNWALWMQPGVRLHNDWSKADDTTVYWVELYFRDCPFALKEVEFCCKDFTPGRWLLKCKFVGQSSYVTLVDAVETCYKSKISRTFATLKLNLLRFEFCGGCFSKHVFQKNTNVDIFDIKLRGIVN